MHFDFGKLLTASFARQDLPEEHMGGLTPPSSLDVAPGQPPVSTHLLDPPPVPSHSNIPSPSLSLYETPTGPHSLKRKRHNSLSSSDVSPSQLPMDLPPEPMALVLSQNDVTLPCVSATPHESHKARKKRNSHTNRKRKRRREAQKAELGYNPRLQVRQKYIPSTKGHIIALSSESTHNAGSRFVSMEAWEPNPTTVYSLADLVGPASHFGFQLIEWDGSTILPLLDATGRIIAVLAGQPNDDSWAQAHQAAADRLEQARSECHFPQGYPHALDTGIRVVHSEGQLRLGKINHGANDVVLASLIPFFLRFAGFASGAFQTWAPRLHDYYTQHLRTLLAHDADAQRPFRNSIWATATFDFGPSTTWSRRYDTSGLAFGWCSVTTLGAFDPKRGGHLVLWDAQRVVEFPPGSTVLIPSAAVAHSTVPVQQGERRYAFTQHTPSAIFRWVQSGFQSLSSKCDQGDGALEVEDRLEEALGLFSTLEELKALCDPVAGSSTE